MKIKDNKVMRKTLNGALCTLLNAVQSGEEHKARAEKGNWGWEDSILYYRSEAIPAYILAKSLTEAGVAHIESPGFEQIKSLEQIRAELRALALYDAKHTIYPEESKALAELLEDK